MRGETSIPNGLQRQGFTGKNLRLGLDVVLEIQQVVVGIHALERQDIRILAIDLDACGSNVNRLHAKRGNRYDGHDRQEKRQDQPLMLAENQKVIVKMRLAGRKVPGRKTR